MTLLRRSARGSELQYFVGTVGVSEMRSGVSRRGTVLILAILLMVVVSLLLSVAASRLFHSSRAFRLRGVEEMALFEARGGVRWGTEQYRKEGKLPPTVFTDGIGELTVRFEEGRIEATCVVTLEQGQKDVQTVSADLDLSQWREE